MLIVTVRQTTMKMEKKGEHYVHDPCYLSHEWENPAFRIRIAFIGRVYERTQTKNLITVDGVSQAQQSKTQQYVQNISNGVGK